MKFYNTLTRTKQVFEPLIPWKVWIYSCGVTVYSHPHIWNMRKYFLDDLVKNVLRHVCWYDVTHVVNITDVWHLSDDGDVWQDKMEKWAHREWITAREVAKKYENIFHDYCKQLRLDEFEYMPRATDHIKEQITMIHDLTIKWLTYTLEDGIYMDTSLIEYGELVWHQHISGLQSWARIDDTGKHHVTDFALWKFSPKSEKRHMEWIFDGERAGELIDDRLNLLAHESATYGFPWWHIECSAMSIAYLWNHFDIHTWGVDHIPIHHTNEIAQSQAFLGDDQSRVPYRIHHQFLNINGWKISKSIPESVIIFEDIIARWYEIVDLRYFFLQAHYRSFQDFTREWLAAARTARLRLKKLVAWKLSEYQDVTIDVSISELSHILCDDFDTPKLLAAIRSWWDIQHILRLDRYIIKLWLTDIDPVPQDITDLANQRRDAKTNKNFEKADHIRQELYAKWRMTLDTPDWFTLEKK